MATIIVGENQPRLSKVFSTSDTRVFFVTLICEEREGREEVEIVRVSETLFHTIPRAFGAWICIDGSWLRIRIFKLERGIV